MDLLDLFVKIGVKDEASDKVSSLGSKLKSGLSTAGKVAATGIGLVTGAASAAAGALLALESSTEEYRVAQGKLNTAFEAAGYSTETASEAYNEFYKILGDTDTATEASQLLAKLAESEEDVSTWTGIAAGVYGTFGDSLPIEGLIEAANETAKVGEVTGTLADALNWAGISEDDFNAALAECTDETERNQFIMDTLAGTYDEASDAFYRNNEAIISARSNQAMLDETMAKLGGTVSDVKNRLMTEFLPGISAVAEGLAGMLSGTEGAEEQFSTALNGLIDTVVGKLPEFLDMGVQIISSLLSGLIQSIPSVLEAIPQLVTSIGTALSELLPQIWEMGSQIVVQLSEGFKNGFPNFMSKIPEFLSQMVNNFTTALPQMLSIGTEVINNIVNGVLSAIPNLLSAVPQVFDALTTYFTEGLPNIVESGKQILQNLINGIVETIPKLVEALPQILQSFLNFVMSSLPSIVESGMDMLMSLVTGIIDALPDLIASIPQIITSFIETLVNNLPQIIETGIQMLISLVTGLIEAIPQLIASLPKIIEAIVNGIGSLLGSIVEIGGNIVQGIWEGISGAASWLWEQITGWFNGIVDGIKGLFGIASPSKLMRDEVGKNLGLGVAEGLRLSTKAAVNAANELGKAVYSETAGWMEQENGLLYDFNGNVTASYVKPAEKEDEAESFDKGGKTTIIQYIQSVPMSPVELARQSVDAFDRLRWA